jgi:NAD(P)-dependent dehydrogenase (short-subunit alcohol dehydrogenase family)
VKRPRRSKLDGRCRRRRVDRPGHRSVARRAGTPDEVGTVGALLMGPDAGFITGSDVLTDGGVTATFWYGDSAG